jgi:hypothetical protein
VSGTACQRLRFSPPSRAFLTCSVFVVPHESWPGPSCRRGTTARRVGQAARRPPAGRWSMLKPRTPWCLSGCKRPRARCFHAYVRGEGGRRRGRSRRDPPRGVLRVRSFSSSFSLLDFLGAARLILLPCRCRAVGGFPSAGAPHQGGLTEAVAEVASGQAEIVHLNTEERKLRDQVDGKISLAFAVLSKFFGRLFDVVDACLDSLRREAWARGGGTPMPAEGARRGKKHPPQGIRRP